MPYIVQLIEHITKLININTERSLTDLVLYDLIICGIKEITEVKHAIKPNIAIIILPLMFTKIALTTLTTESNIGYNAETLERIYKEIIILLDKKPKNLMFL